MRLPLWRLTTLRRQLFELASSERYSRPSVGRIEEKLERYFTGPGVFVEAGALDGYFESNTYYLEKFRGWRGVLVEPVVEMFQRLSANRPAARAFNCALVSFDFPDSVIPIVAAHAMSKVDHAPSNGAHPVATGASRLVPARTLTSVLDEAGVDSVDLLSLDVEGFETQVLQGLDFSKCRPRYILVECLTPQLEDDVNRLLSDQYRFVEKFTYRDVFYAAR